MRKYPSLFLPPSSRSRAGESKDCTAISSSGRGSQTTFKSGLFLTGLLLLTVISLQAGAWPQKKGEGYLKLGTRLTLAHHFVNEGGVRVAIPPYADFMTHFYGEYGLLEGLTLIASVPLYREVSSTVSFPVLGGGLNTERYVNRGISDPELGFRIGLFRAGAWVFSSELLLGLPLGEDMHPMSLLLGDGEFNQILKLQMGYSFYPRPLYFSAEVGLNNRTRGYSDEIRYEAEFGYIWQEKLQFILKLRGIQSLQNGDPTVVGTRGFPNNQNSLIYAPEVNYLLKENLGISVSAEGPILAHNFLYGVTYALGFFLQLR